MKRFAAFMIALCVVTGFLGGRSAAEAKGPATFATAPKISKRDLPAFLPMLRWDMTMEELKAAQLGAPPVVTGDTAVYYGVSLLDQLATVVCTFGGRQYDSLDMVLIVLAEGELDPQQSYKKLSAALNEQYGEPGSVSRQWLASGEGDRSGAAAVANGAYQEFAYYEGLGFHLSCTLEDWDGTLVASALFQRGGALGALDYANPNYSNVKLEKKLDRESPVGVFALTRPTQRPASATPAQEVTLPGPARIPAGIAWGMSRGEVRALETARKNRATEDSAGWLRYASEQPDGRMASTAYYFEDDALSRIYYIYEDEHEDKGRHMDDFDEVSESLAEALGEPTDSGLEWRRSAYQGDPEWYGLAVSLGDLRVNEIWVLNDMSVTHEMTGEDHVVTHYLEYAAPER